MQADSRNVAETILSEIKITLKFIYLQTLLWTLGPLEKAFYYFRIDPRDRRHHKLKSCRWMRQPMTGFENTEHTPF